MSTMTSMDDVIRLLRTKVRVLEEECMMLRAQVPGEGVLCMGCHNTWLKEQKKMGAKPRAKPREFGVRIAYVRRSADSGKYMMYGDWTADIGDAELYEREANARGWANLYEAVRVRVTVEVA